MGFGRPTGSAMPLLWAHAEYVKLLRSIADGRVFDLILAVAERYLGARRQCMPVEVWKPNRHAKSIRAGHTLRVIAWAPFTLRWTRDEWRHVQDVASTWNALGVHYVDLRIEKDQRAPIRFTLFWPREERWEGRDYGVEVTPDDPSI